MSRTVSGKFSNKRLEVLRGSARVFSRLGFHRASLNDVGEALNITPPALYYYVKSKDELLVECGRIAFEQLSEALIAAKAQGLSGMASLMIFFRHYAEIITDDFGRCLVITQADDLIESMREENLDGRRALDREVREMIRQGIKDGSIKDCDARMLSSLLFGAINSLSRWWSPRGIQTPGQISDVYLKMIFEGMSPLPAPITVPPTAQRTERTKVSRKTAPAAKKATTRKAAASTRKKS